jgi:hypothetical protein
MPYLHHLQSKEDDADIKVADFGFARRVHTPQSLTTRCGTPTVRWTQAGKIVVSSHCSSYSTPLVVCFTGDSKECAARSGD